MTEMADPSNLTTVSRAFIEDWLLALAARCTEAEMRSLLLRAGLNKSRGAPAGRVTLDQIVTLYQLAAVESGDEMMGLWSRPIRARALQHLVTTVASADALPAALYRFSTFWNLLLDDFRFDLNRTGDLLELALTPRADAPPQRFGHLLILKLAHGLLSWRARYELPVNSVCFAFPRPAFAADYAVVFPAPVTFDAPCSAIRFDAGAFDAPPPRSKTDLTTFIRRAPRDWIFTRHHEHSESLRVREFLFRSDWTTCRLSDAARAFGMSPRTLMRRLAAEDSSFQTIKDDLRRDIALQELRDDCKSTERIAEELGFSSATNFHRAFQRWTGSRPSSFRRLGP